MSEQALRFTLKNVKVLGFDPSIKNKYGKFSALSNISDEDADKINSFIFGKVAKNQDGENVFYLDSRTEIFIFDENKKRITEPINHTFLANASVLIDEFQSKDENKNLEYNDDGTPKIIRYIKTEAIKYISEIKGEATKMVQRARDNYDDFFADEEELTIPAISQPSPAESNQITDQVEGDLPFQPLTDRCMSRAYMPLFIDY